MTTSDDSAPSKVVSINSRRAKAADTAQVTLHLARGNSHPALRDAPQRANGYNRRMKLDDREVTLRTTEFKDGTLCEIVVDMPYMSPTYREGLRAFSDAVSMGLRGSTPLEVLVSHFMNISGDIKGCVSGHDQIYRATSVYDLVFRELAIAYLGREDLIQEDIYE